MLTLTINITLLLASLLVPLSPAKAKRKKTTYAATEITIAYSDYAINENGELEYFDKKRTNI